MRVWSIPLDAPHILTLAADARSDDFNPDDDQVWRLMVSEHEPRGIALHSTFGLRAKSMRILSGFELNGEVRTDPDTFESPARVQIWLPSYISLVFRPFPEFKVSAEYWARSSSLLAGRYTFSNLSERAIQPGLRISSILQAAANPEPMSARIENGVQILSGRTANLYPLIFLDGGARSEPSPYSMLRARTLLAPGEKHSWIWAHCGEQTVARGFHRSRELRGINWDAEVARLLMQNSDLVDVDTGDLGWDAALWAAQREASMLFIRPNRRLKRAVPVETRTEKDGYDAAEGRSPWEPANPWDAFYVALQSLPGSPESVQGYVESMLHLQAPDGHVPAITDFASPQKGWLHPPLLAQMALQLYRKTEDVEFIDACFQALHSLFNCWFQAEHDRDMDGFPEWDHVNQAGFKSWPAFSPWFEWSQGLELSTAETIDLASLLVMEGEALIAMAMLLGFTDAQEAIGKRVGLLKGRIEAAWSETDGYKHVDYYLHESVAGKRLAVRRGGFTLEVHRDFDPAVRLLLQVEGQEDRAHDLKMRIFSRGRRGPSRVEKFDYSDFAWFLDCGYLTTDKPSAEIEKIEVEGIDRKFRTTISTGDYSRDDVTLLLPLTAGLPSDSRADFMVEHVLKDPGRFWRCGGVPSVPADDPDYAIAANKVTGSVQMLRNHWLAEGLLRYGYKEEAAELLTRLMGSVVKTLREEHCFYAEYDADGEAVLRENVSAAGLAPFSLLLKVLGVELIAPRKVRIRPGHELGRTIRLKWRGLEITCDPEATLVRFPDGGVVEVTGSHEQIVEQSNLS